MDVSQYLTQVIGPWGWRLGHVKALKWPSSDLAEYRIECVESFATGRKICRSRAQTKHTLMIWSESLGGRDNK